jgi:hypothetical protein
LSLFRQRSFDFLPEFSCQLSRGVFQTLYSSLSGEFSALQQACAHDVPADPKQAGSFQLIAIAILVSGADDVSFNGFVKMTATFLEKSEEGILERLSGMVRQGCGWPRKVVYS